MKNIGASRRQSSADPPHPSRAHAPSGPPRQPARRCRPPACRVPLASFSRRRSRALHTTAAALCPTPRPPPDPSRARSAPQHGTFNRLRQLFCSSGLCYNRSPWRRSHKLASLRPSRVPSKAEC
ncbi:unnamed protein product [Pieris brassicae]|uniref:Uncharacterized protein n=1 Tax=Pieris brassicae TaxID=7116 RepID=A0A9P0SDG4_PIEBR|nr:unnamed protein product [Pieris brassicae]